MAISVHNRKIAIALAFAGASPLPLAWLHKFYLGQYLWGITYLVLAGTGLPQIACCFEGIWYLSQSDDSFSKRFPGAGSILQSLESQPSAAEAAEAAEMKAIELPNSNVAIGNIRVKLANLINRSFATKPDTEPNDSKAGHKTSQIAIALRELDQLRKEGLITEYEFEQKRRKLLAQV